MDQHTAWPLWSRRRLVANMGREHLRWPRRVAPQLGPHRVVLRSHRARVRVRPVSGEPRSGSECKCSTRRACGRTTNAAPGVVVSAESKSNTSSSTSKPLSVLGERKRWEKGNSGALQRPLQSRRCGHALEDIVFN